MASRIEDYALIGDCQSAALVGRNGSMDWLCFPRFDSGACFAALLGTPEHGRWLLAPREASRCTRWRYRPETLVLESDWETSTGAVTVVDCMPPRVDLPDVVRVVEGRRGQVRMRMELTIRFDYGSIVPWVRRVPEGLSAIGGPDAVLLRTPIEMRGEELRTVADFTVSAGERVPFTLTWFPSHRPPPSPLDPGKQIAETERWWQEWSSRCTYRGEWRDAVIRSLITLKALTYAPTGGMVAASTTSLPEALGGVRNWDYRYCWIRDATFSLYALMIGGFVEEAGAWRDWLLRAVAGHPADAQIMYGVGGERRLQEIELDWLAGYERSAPVRIGNAAHRQFQLDVYGEIMDVFHSARRHGLRTEEVAWRVQREMVEYVSSVWREPDEGIWEVRGSRLHFTHSKVMAWVALDRAVKAVEQWGLDGPADRWRRTRDAIRDDVCSRGFDPALQSFVQSYGAREVDASLLMIPLVGFLPATDARMLGTVRRIQDTLVHEGFVRRYETTSALDGLPPGEAAFLPCTLWLADNLALQGRGGEARSVFDRVLRVRTDLGLLAEEYSPALGRLLGNFPQALSHVALINTARNLTAHGGPAEHRPAR